MKFIVILFIVFLPSFAFAQYWQQQVDMNIAVSLDDSAHALDGMVKMKYHNNSRDTLNFIWIHLWPNAYKNDRTAFSEQMLQFGNTRFYFAADSLHGYINRLAFRVNGDLVNVEDHPLHQDIVKILLPQKLVPCASIEIETPFHVQLPYNFSRGGHVGKSYQLTQWFPNPAVYDRYGWHPMPYLDQGEFYSEFGNYRVRIQVPSKYIIAATGNKVSEENTGSYKVVDYEQNNIHDFAWFADKNFETLTDTLMLNGRAITVNAFFFARNKKLWKNSITFIKRAVRTKSEWIGEYPYDVVSVVEKPQGGDGGMEYPTITLISSPSSEQSLDFVINHEVGHNWFYGILASNERRYPWMDEGINSYYDRRYASLFYKNAGLDIGTKNKFIRNRFPEDVEVAALTHILRTRQDQPIGSSSEDLNQVNYNLGVYTKAALWLQQLEQSVGSSTFDSLMKKYYSQWQFRHPYPEDFKILVEKESGKNVDSLFSLLDKKGFLIKQHSKKLKLSFGFNAKNATDYNYISFLPVPGYNMYDKFMAGLLIHNYSIPASKFRFAFVPMYATGSKQLTGIGRAGYTIYPGAHGNRIELSVSASRFSSDIYTDLLKKEYPLVFTKIAPALRYTFAKQPLSTSMNYLQWKTFYIRETNLLFTRDTVNQRFDVSFPEESRYLNQLQIVFSNRRALYPYKYVIQGEHAKQFIRTSVTANQFFNYAEGGGASVRLFAGLFFYTTEKTPLVRFETQRYHLTMSAPRGYEDYTYNNYFVGRNEFEGFASQQMMIRDGGFKVAQDLNITKAGVTDKWLAAINFTTTIPKKFNPLSVLPVKLPLKLFLDVGTYEDPSDEKIRTNKFLYDAGVQLSLFNVINIYMPVLYSKVYRDYYKSTIQGSRLLKTLSFSIDLQNLSFNKFFPQSFY